MNPLLTHYGFTHAPFARATGTAALVHHRGFEEARKRLRFTVELDSIATLVSEPGCGKSLLLGEIADEMQREGWAVHYFAHATCNPFGLVNVLARKAGLTPRRSRAETATAIGETLLADERRHLLLLDEAHALPDDTLEDVRLLTIGEYDRKSPFVLLLAGQPALDERLAEPVHHALDQRITTVARLEPLSLEETRQYVDVRLKAAGAKKPVFDPGALGPLFEATGGVPRRINGLATGALVVAAARNRRLVTDQDIHDARLDRGRA
ncbi:MAG: AAA family ATPase [Deltaproteobacteria bacterium]|jgi:type II secretory pathway predicted ATPase ExeA|nr:AAA family ATPase [Deltaproteobacteria bacterium]